MKAILIIAMLWSVNAMAGDKSPSEKQIDCKGVEVQWDATEGFSATKGDTELNAIEKPVCIVRLACNGMKPSAEGLIKAPEQDMSADQMLECVGLISTVQSNDDYFESMWDGDIPNTGSRKSSY